MAAPVQDTPTISKKKSFDAASAVIAAACGLSLATTLLALAILPLRHGFAGSRDFAFYWATGRQLLRHGNPYDARAMGALEHGAGFAGSTSQYMRNPPWALWMALPLGLASARAAALPWSLLLLLALAGALDSLWKTFGRPEQPADWLGYCFPPAMICVAMGQLSVFLLLGLAWFLRFHRTRPFWAGAALWFCTLKPHVMLPFAAALAVWLVATRNWRVVAGTAAALASSAAMTEWLDPHAWGQYWSWTQRSGISQEAIPCLSVALRTWLAPAHAWVDFVPVAVACVGAVAFFWRRRARWDWAAEGGLLVLVSLAAAPYGWINDQCVAIAPLMWAAGRTRSNLVRGALGILCLAIAIQVLLSKPIASAWYLWPSAAWPAWWVWARAKGTDSEMASA